MESAVVRTFVLGFSALILACPGSGRAAPSYVMAAVSDPARPAEQVELDQWRKPAEVIGPCLRSRPIFVSRWGERG